MMRPSQSASTSELRGADAAPVQLDASPHVQSREGQPISRIARQDGRPPGGFVFDLVLDRFFSAWQAVSKDGRQYRRSRRDTSSRKWLGTRCSTRFLWRLVSSLKCFVDKPLPVQLFRGMRCRHKETQRAGTFLSCGERGICKVLFDGDQEPAFVLAAQLLRIHVAPHPFLAGLAFLAWALAHAENEDLKIDGLRTALLFGQVMGKQGKGKTGKPGKSGQLTMLAVMQEEAAKGLRFCFSAWKTSTRKRTKFPAFRRLMGEAFQGWLEALLRSRSDRAQELLQTTQVGGVGVPSCVRVSASV